MPMLKALGWLKSQQGPAEQDVLAEPWGWGGRAPLPGGVPAKATPTHLCLGAAGHLAVAPSSCSSG